MSPFDSLIDWFTKVVEWANDNEPAGLLVWTSVALSIVLTIWKLYDIWRNRERIELKVVTTYVHCRYWHENDFRGPNTPDGEIFYSQGAPTALGSGIVVRPGQCKFCFEVLEFTLKNRYSHDITIGAFLIADWMFSDHYTPGMYDKRRDYKAFDLFTRKSINLEDYKTLPPGGVMGMRIESVEESNGGPGWASNHSHYTVDVPKSYLIEFNSDMGRLKYKIVPSAPEKMPVAFEYEYRWSEQLLNYGPTVQVAGASMPQSIPQSSPYDAQWRWRLRGRVNKYKGKLSATSRAVYDTLFGHIK